MIDFSALPSTDPTPIFELYRGNYASELLTAAIYHFDLFRKLADCPMSLDEAAIALDLAARPANVLLVALQAMGMLKSNAAGRLELSPVAREHLLPGGAFYVGDYVGLAADAPGVKLMVERLRHNRPSGAKAEDGGADGAQFIFKEGSESAMEHAASARNLTLALAGRAKNVAPHLAKNFPLSDAKVLLDVGGGTGLYSLALLAANPKLRAIVWDRAEVLKVAREFAQAAGLADRIELRPGDMFADPVPAGVDVALVSNILHDWDVPDCRQIISRIATALAPGGRLLIHDVFLNDTLDGPLPIALYSAALFSVTEGRAYSAAEYSAMLEQAALTPEKIVPTFVHCGALAGRKAV